MQHRQKQRAWEAKGRALPRATDNTERVRSQIEKMHAQRAAAVAARTAERLRAEREKDEEHAALVHATRVRAQEARARQAERVRSSSAHAHSQREGVVGSMREQQSAHEDQIHTSRQHEADAHREQRDGIARVLSPGNVRDFKAQEQARKAQRAERLKAEREEQRRRLDAARRDEDERKRQLHNAVRKAALDGFGDREKTAYSSYMHSGTSHQSLARDDGRHDYKHDLPSSRAPYGRWLREYAKLSASSTSVVSV